MEPVLLKRPPLTLRNQRVANKCIIVGLLIIWHQAVTPQKPQPVVANQFHFATDPKLQVTPKLTFCHLPFPPPSASDLELTSRPEKHTLRVEEW
jgi:hypothetical protein